MTRSRAFTSSSSSSLMSWVFPQVHSVAPVEPELVFCNAFAAQFLVPDSDFDPLIANRSQQDEAGVQGEGGGNYYNTTVKYLGDRYLDLAFAKYYRSQISIYDLSEYLGVKVDYIPRLEAERGSPRD